MKTLGKHILHSSIASAAWSFHGTCDGDSRLELSFPADNAETGLATLAGNSGLMRTWIDPCAALRWVGSEGVAMLSPGDRWVGFVSYDFAWRLDGAALARGPSGVQRNVRDDLGLPLFRFVRLRRAETFRGDFTAPPEVSQPVGKLRANFTRAQYERAVERVLEYIAAGDIFQANLSQRFDVSTADTAEAIFCRLMRSHPARYGALLDYGDFAIVSNSPELFLRVEPGRGSSRRIITRPIKGTRPLAPGMEADLRQSTKDQAELNMIVDLERNDLGRVCEIGSVHVTQPREIEAHQTVYHGVATIEGALRSDVQFDDLLRAVFPGGSVTGAPKIRAMQIIDELEPARRGHYCGAIGYLAADGSMEFNVAIRTMTLKDGCAYVSVGGGVVADSDPAGEFTETLVKARAMLAALGVSPPSDRTAD